MEHRRDVPGGDIRTCASCGSCRWPESASGSQGVWVVAGDGTEDAAVRGAARLSATAADQAAQAGSMAGRDRCHFGRRQAEAGKATAHRQADLRAAKGRARFHWRLHDREGLRAVGYVHQVVIACGSEVIARHQRSYEREVVVFDPLHYLALLEQKTRALDQAAPLAGWLLPGFFAQLRRLLEARLKKHGSREYVQVLRLMETFALSEVTQAIEDALLLGTISFDAVRHLL